MINEGSIAKLLGVVDNSPKSDERQKMHGLLERLLTFQNKAYPDFRLPVNRALMRGALWTLQKEYLGNKYPHIFPSGAVFARKGKTYSSIDPNHPSTKIGQFQRYDKETMDLTLLVEGANRVLPLWNELGIEKRAKVLEKAADHLEDRIWLVAASLVKEWEKVISRHMLMLQRQLTFCVGMQYLHE